MLTESEGAPAPNDPLDELAEQINQAHHNLISAAKQAIESARAVGEGMLAAKAQVGHGEFYPWLNKNCPSISRRHAQRYMKIASNWAAIEDAAEDPATLSLRGALRLIGPEKDTDETTGAGAAAEAANPTRVSDLDAVPMPELGERTVMYLGKGATMPVNGWVEIIPRDDEEGYFVTKRDEAGFDLNMRAFREDGARMVVKFYLEDLGFGEADDVITCLRVPHPPLPGDYHPLCEPESWHPDPNPNCQVYWLTSSIPGILNRSVALSVENAWQIALDQVGGEQRLQRKYPHADLVPQTEVEAI